MIIPFAGFTQLEITKIRVNMDTAAGRNDTLHIVGDSIFLDGETFARDSIHLDKSTAARLLATDATQTLVSTNLNTWVAGTSGEITITDDGDGSITVSLPDTITATADTSLLAIRAYDSDSLDSQEPSYYRDTIYIGDYNDTAWYGMDDTIVIDSVIHAQNSDSLGGKAPFYYVDTVTVQNITGEKTFDNIVADSISGDSAAFTGQVVVAEIDANSGKIDGTIIGANSAASATVTTFTSTGIDDNASINALTIEDTKITVSDTLAAKDGDGVTIVDDDDTFSATFKDGGDVSVTKIIADEAGNYGVNTGYWFSDAKVGIYEAADNQMYFITNDINRFTIINDGAFCPQGAFLRNIAPTATTPCIIPDRANNTTGIGAAAADQLSLIAGGVEGIRITEATSITVDVNGCMEVDDTIKCDSIKTIKAGAWADFVFDKKYKIPSIYDKYHYAMKYGHMKHLQADDPEQTHVTDGDIQRRLEGLVREVEELTVIIYKQQEEIIKLKLKR